MKSIIILTGCLCFCALSVSGCDATVIEADVATQSRIDEIVLQLIHAKTQSEIDASLAVLKRFEQEEKDKVALMEQIIYYLRYGASSEERGYGAIILFNKLDVADRSKAEAALVCLGVQDIDFHKIAIEVLGTIDSPDGSGVDFSVYEELLLSSIQSPPQALIKYMYQTDLKSALSSLATVYLGKEQAKVFLEKVRGEDDKLIISNLSQQSEWWVHLYIAEKIRLNQKLRVPELMELLRNSRHELVREAVQEIEREK